MERTIPERRNYGSGWWATVLLAMLCAAVFALPASAQEPREYELGAGYAYMRVDSSAGALSLHGVNFSLARNANGWLAVMADLSGYHLEGFRLGTYLFGPRFTVRPGQKASVFGQALFGGAHANAGGRGFPAYHDSVALAFGGGLNYRVNDHVAIRLAQADYVQTRLGGAIQHNLRAGVGVVLHFGAASGRPD